MRRIDFKHQQRPDGGINNRTEFPSPPRPTGEQPFADGHASCILKAYREALNLALREEMRRDPDVFVIGEEVGLYEGAYKVTQGLLKEFGPKRIVDTPIAESSIAGIALGLSLAGLLADRFDRIGPALAIVAIGPLLLATLVITRYPETAHRELEDINPEDR